ncbi:hypothetical protein WICMUC_004180 [Wickerhamomyces mucosus]|uniref:Uncharacterized protein n=1 Tax=Wickerhamomyces mucosus TaxID=1378264 RepID=A0A9P8PJX9_9ASCO|nr:hypothetical protein WICMUC_004180 [Wickerhamomyces mucosus]
MSARQIAFPEDIKSSKEIHFETPSALKYINSLLYRSGTLLSLTYFLLICILQPLLQLQYEKRVEFQSYVLKKARFILSLIINHNKSLPSIAYKVRNKIYSDAQVQTEISEDNTESWRPKQISFYPHSSAVTDSTSKTHSINRNLKKLSNIVNELKDQYIEINEINPCLFQVKKFQGRIDYYKNLKLFKDTKTSKRSANESDSTSIRNEIRTIKGWYLNGQV